MQTVDAAIRLPNISLHPSNTAKARNGLYLETSPKTVIRTNHTTNESNNHIRQKQKRSLDDKTLPPPKRICQPIKKVIMKPHEIPLKSPKIKRSNTRHKYPLLTDAQGEYKLCPKCGLRFNPASSKGRWKPLHFHVRSCKDGPRSPRAPRPMTKSKVDRVKASDKFMKSKEKETKYRIPNHDYEAERAETLRIEEEIRRESARRDCSDPRTKVIVVCSKDVNPWTNEPIYYQLRIPNPNPKKTDDHLLDTDGKKYLLSPSIKKKKHKNSHIYRQRSASPPKDQSSRNFRPSLQPGCYQSKPKKKSKKKHKSSRNSHKQKQCAMCHKRPADGILVQPPAPNRNKICTRCNQSMTTGFQETSDNNLDKSLSLPSLSSSIELPAFTHDGNVSEAESEERFEGKSNKAFSEISLSKQLGLNHFLDLENNHLPPPSNFEFKEESSVPHDRLEISSLPRPKTVPTPVLEPQASEDFPMDFDFSRSSTNTNGTYSPPMSSYGPSPIGSYIGRSPSGFSPITNNQALSDIPSIPMDQGFLSPFGSFQPGTDVADILAEDFKSNKIFSYGEQPNKQPETPPKLAIDLLSEDLGCDLSGNLTLPSTPLPVVPPKQVSSPDENIPPTTDN